MPPIDLSTAQARPSASGRSRSAIRPAAPATVTSRDFQREIAAGAQGFAAGQGLQGLGNSLSTFFRTRADQGGQVEHLKNLQKIDEENARFAVEAGNTVLQRPKAFREALETGDWSAFPEITPEKLGRSAFIDTGRKLLGQLEAREMAADPEFLARLSNSESPDRAREEYLKEQMGGADPLFAASLQSEFFNRTDKAVAERKAVIQLEAAETMYDRAILNFTNNLDTVSGVEDMMSHMGAVRRSFETLGPLAMAEAEDRASRELMRLAYVEGDTRALKLVKAKDPEWHDNLSIENRFPEDAAELNAQGARNFGATQSREQAEQIARIAEAVTLQDIPSALEAITAFEEANPGVFNAKVLALKGQIIGMTGRVANIEDAWSQAIENGANTQDVTESRKTDKDIFARFFSPEFTAGRTRDEVVGALGSWMRASSFSADAKGRASQVLHGTSPENRRILLDAYKTIPDHLRGSKFTSEDTNVAELLVGAMETGEDPEALFEQLKAEGAPKFSEAEAIRTVYGLEPKAERRLLDSSLDDGLPESGQGFFASSPLVGANLRAFSDRAFRQLVRQFPNQPQERIEARHQQIVNQRAALIKVGDNFVWDLADDVQIQSTGIPWKSPDAPYLEEAERWINEANKAVAAVTRAPVPEDVRTTEDVLSALAGGQPVITAPTDSSVGEVQDLVIDGDSYFNAGLVPTFLHKDGSARPLRFQVGKIHYIPPDERNDPKWAHFSEVTDAPPSEFEEEAGFIPLLVEGAGDLIIDERTIWRHDAESNELTYRYTGPDNSAEAEIGRIEDSYVTGQAPSRPTTNETRARGQRMGRFFQNRQKEAGARITPLNETGRSILHNSQPETPEDVVNNVDQAVRSSRLTGTALLNYASPEGQEYYNNVYTPFLIEQEGVRYFAYDDKTKRRITPGIPIEGDRTVAIGFNLDKFPKAREVLAQAGLENKQIDDLYAGKFQLDQKHVDNIQAIVGTKTARALWARYKDVAGDLTQRQWAGLMSLHHHGVTETPKMTEAIKAGDWETVAQEVLFRSESGVDPDLLDSVRARRIREAVMLLGGRVNQQPFLAMFQRAKDRLVKQSAIKRVPEFG
jgi:hypothetical protein